MTATRTPEHLEAEDDDAPPEGRTTTRQRIVRVLVALLCLLLVFFSGEIAAIGVRRAIDARLSASGAGANAGLVSIESEQLSLLREITFTSGVAGDLAAENGPALDQAVTPLQANSDVPMVDMVLPDGRVIFAVRSQGAPRPVADRSGLAAVGQSIAEAGNARAGRFTELVTLQSSPVLLTVGPVLVNAHAVGVVLVMTPLADVLGRLASESGVALTAYNASGSPIATTSSANPPSISAAQAHQLLASNVVATRETAGATREMLGQLVIDHHAAALLGAAVHDDAFVIEFLVDCCAILALLLFALFAYLLRRRLIEQLQRP